MHRYFIVKILMTCWYIIPRLNLTAMHRCFIVKTSIKIPMQKNSCNSVSLSAKKTLIRAHRNFGNPKLCLKFCFFRVWKENQKDKIKVQLFLCFIFCIFIISSFLNFLTTKFLKFKYHDQAKIARCDMYYYRYIYIKNYHFSILILYESMS